MHGVMNMKDEDGFEPTSESTHLSLPTRYELANGFTSTPSRLLGDLEEKHLPQTFSIATRVAHDGIRIAVTSVPLCDTSPTSVTKRWPPSRLARLRPHTPLELPVIM